MRSYIRHPSDIPIHVDEHDSGIPAQHVLSDVSQGGLAFNMNRPLEKGACLTLTIDTVNPPFSAEGVVTHCHQREAHYVIGVEFTNRDDLFVARMVEQICHIEHYKREVALREGRQVSGEQAAHEWIERYASQFPNWN